MLLRDRWEKSWPFALSIWSKFLRLKPPMLCLLKKEAQSEGLIDSFAMIRLQDQAIIVNLPEIDAIGVGEYPLEILAHEIGHHVFAPATLTEHARMIARMRWALPTVENQASMVANLYTDILINDRLMRNASLKIADIYRILGGNGGGTVWALYMRIYEILWSLERGSLGGGKTDDRLEGDAWLGARLIRSYSYDWLEGSGRFASLLLPHLLKDKNSIKLIEKLLDTRHAASNGIPIGLTEEESGERDGAIHPANDPILADFPDDMENGSNKAVTDPPDNIERNQPSSGQLREPFEFGEILRAAGIKLTDHEAAVKYYRESASRYLIPFPVKKSPQNLDQLPEGLEPWDIGDAIDDADWMQTVLQSPHVIPGMTTVQRVWGTSVGHEKRSVPLDLDLYVDSSGSMPNPQRQLSYPALAGTILCLSALRAGAQVQVTLWSGKHQFMTTKRFVRDEERILQVLTGYFGGATAFPIHILRDTYSSTNRRTRPSHVMVISDDGVSTMFDRDEFNNNGWNIAEASLRNAGGGGTFVLNLRGDWETAQGESEKIKRARDEMGWLIYRVASLEELVEFARQFSRNHYHLSKTALSQAGEG
ncbi:VWA domain-containing protein [candidate division KSB1 bacterium]|nr:VWA domain-containing protein [candidate division KSB1 bacterium]